MFKVGDIVLVKPDIQVSGEYYMITCEMLQYRGKMFKIDRIEEHYTGDDVYFLEGEGDNYYSWHESWLLPVAKNKGREDKINENNKYKRECKGLGESRSREDDARIDLFL